MSATDGDGVTLSMDATGIDLTGSLGVLALLPGDPTVRVEPGRFRRATLTPEGPATIDVRWQGDRTTADITTCGPGAAWLAARAGAFVGLTDDPSSFDPTHPVVRRLWRERPGLRVISTGTVWHDVAWWIVQQRITGRDAAQQWRRLVRAHGRPAPGSDDLLCPPAPDVIADLPLHAFHRLGIEQRRARHLVAAARQAHRLAALADRPYADAAPVLRSVEGIGPWTASGLAAVTWGEPDTVIVGDSGIPHLVAWMLSGERRSDDTRMLELLEPFRPHRYRVIQLSLRHRPGPPRRHHRLSGIDIRRL
jgi:3-methyladenine DNA glycosylase/8-oxoguanine DNA glycosylase